MSTGKDRIERIAMKAPPAVVRYVRKSIDLADRISIVLESQGKTQKDLATALGKSDSEISKWLGGQHNFTIRTLTAVEEALGVNIFEVPGGKRHAKYYSGSDNQADRGKKSTEGLAAPSGFLASLNFSSGSSSPSKRLLLSNPDIAKEKPAESESDLVLVA